MGLISNDRSCNIAVPGGGEWHSGPTFDPDLGTGSGSYQYVAHQYRAWQRETYAYNAGGALSGVSVAATGYVDNNDGTISATYAYGATGQLAS